MKTIKTLAILSSLIMSISLGMLVGCKKDNTNQTGVKYCDTAHCAHGCDAVTQRCIIHYCDTAHCQGAGICDSATRSCLCPVSTGYEGADCSTEQRAKFLGTYQGTSACNFGSFSDTWIISSGSAGIFSVAMTYGGIGSTPIVGTISGSTVTFPAQSVTFGSNQPETFQGTGTLAINGSSTILTLATTESAQGTTSTCTFIGPKN